MTPPLLQGRQEAVETSLTLNGNGNYFGELLLFSAGFWLLNLSKIINIVCNLEFLIIYFNINFFVDLNSKIYIYNTVILNLKRILAERINAMTENNTSLIMYVTEDGETRIQATFDQETVWLSIDQMAELFQRDKSVIGKHVRSIFSEGELDKKSVWAKFAHTASDGKTYQVDYYNLDVIISVGYRVKSLRGTQFRIWANGVLKDYLLKGYAVNQRIERLENRVSKTEEKIDFFVRTSFNRTHLKSTRPFSDN